MRILIVGAGGIGGTIAGRLAMQGVSVSVCVRHPPASGGITLLEGETEKKVLVTYVGSWSAHEYDLIILTVRPNQLRSALAKSCHGSSVFVVCQNGVCEPLVRELVGEQSTVIGAVVSWGASRVEGRIVQTARGVTTLGRLDGGLVPAEIVEVFKKVHPVALTTNLVGTRWSKLALNAAASALCVLLGGSLGLAFRSPRAISIGVHLIEEVCMVARGAGVDMEPISGTLDLQALFYPPERGTLKKLTSVALLTVFALRYYRLESSMWRAMKAGEPSGIEWICGPIVAAAGSQASARFSRAVMTTINLIEDKSVKQGKPAINRVFALAALERDAN